MSRTLLATRFRAAVGESPMRHLTMVRLSQAAGYLTTTSLSVDAIARRTGYGNSASLSKAFKREFGASPGKYRADSAGGSGGSSPRADTGFPVIRARPRGARRDRQVRHRTAPWWGRVRQPSTRPRSRGESEACSPTGAPWLSAAALAA